MEKKISKKISLLIYGLFLMAGFITALITHRLLYLIIVFCAPAIFFLFFTILSDWKREWDIGFGVFEAFCFWFFLVACKFANFF